MLKQDVAVVSIAALLIWGLALLGVDGPEEHPDDHRRCLLLTVDLTGADGVRLLSSQQIDARTASALLARGGDLYYEARDARGSLLVARDAEVPAKRTAEVAIPLTSGTPRTVRLYRLDGGETKHLLGEVSI